MICLRGDMLYKMISPLVLFRFLMVLVEFQTTCYARNTIASFVFGDSAVDVGNNNYILTLAKVDMYPYGIDFGMATGRFTNGRTIPDIIGQEIGLSGFPPPYLAPTTTGAVILDGVNYASGGAGILNITGRNFITIINLIAQIDNFEKTKLEIISQIGETEAMSLLNNALYTFAFGANDFINEYLINKIQQKLVTPEDFVKYLMSRYRVQLTRIYNLGARRILLANVGTLGCIPTQREMDIYGGFECVTFPNELAQLFNSHLKELVGELRSNLEGSDFVYGNVYDILNEIINNYSFYGFENANSACCYGGGRYGAVISICNIATKVCADRSKYVFFDGFHPTDAAYSIIAKRFVDGDSADIWPKNVRQLVTQGA